MEKEKPNCPECKTNGLVVPIVYGVISFNNKSIKEMGDYKSGGCCNFRSIERINCTEENPQGEVRIFTPYWFCRYCERKF